MPWWGWLIAAGVFLSLVFAGLYIWSVKRVTQIQRETMDWVNEPLGRRGDFPDPYGLRKPFDH